jgi:hypothetical protein
MVFTAYALVLAIRGGLHPGHKQTHWLIPESPIVHGWALIIANVLIYGSFCWIAFWLIHGTAGRERIFMLGFFADILPWPLRVLRPDWAVPIRHFAAIGLAVAVLAAITLLLDPPRVADIADQTNPT